MKPWIGVDLDGTLAEYRGFEGHGMRILVSLSLLC